MVRLNSWLRDVKVLSNSTTIPPPSTVSIVRASRLGVKASKSCMGHDIQRRMQVCSDTETEEEES